MRDAQTDLLAEQRDIVERRQMGWRTVLFGFLRSRRRDMRRADEADFVFVDWHHPWLFFLAVGTMLLSCVDAFMTLLLIELGMYEANPVMAGLLGHSTTAFAAIKMALTGFGILTLVFLSKSRFLDYFRTGILVTAMFTTYACLVCYEFVSFFNML